MASREEEYFQLSGDSVYFAVGSLSGLKGPSTTAGLCYRVTASNIERDIIAQVNQNSSCFYVLFNLIFI
jgi:hypothetical protein